MRKIVFTIAIFGFIASLTLAAPVSAQSSLPVYLVPGLVENTARTTQRVDVRVGDLGDTKTNVVELRLNFSANVEVTSITEASGFLALNKQVKNTPATIDVAKIGKDLESNEVIAQIEFQILDSQDPVLAIDSSTKVGQVEVGDQVSRITFKAPATSAPSQGGLFGASPVVVVVGLVVLVIILGLLGGYGIAVILSRRKRLQAFTK